MALLKLPHLKTLWPNMYNEFYTPVGKTNAEKAKTLTKNLGFSAFDNKSKSNKDTNECSSRQEFYFKPVAEQEIHPEDSQGSPPLNKAPGADKVTARILKATLPVMMPLLTNLIKCSVLLRYFCTIVEIDRSSAF